MKTIAIVCPVYEEASNIPNFFKSLKTELDLLRDRYTWRILFVIDPGKDQTEAVVESLSNSADNVHGIIMSRRFGHQAALLAGIDHVHSDVVIMMDCDNQHPPCVIHDLIAQYEMGFEVVQTIRTYNEDEGWFKKMSSSLFYEILQNLSEITIVKNGADYRLISSRVCNVFKSSIKERNQFLRGLFSWIGFRQSTVPFHAANRESGSSKYNTARKIGFAVAGTISFSKTPIRYSCYCGILVAMLGFGVAFLTLIQWLAGANFPAGWATIIALIAIIGGAQLIFLGVMGEYIAGIFDEVKGRPHYLIDRYVGIMDDFEVKSSF